MNIVFNFVESADLSVVKKLLHRILEKQEATMATLQTFSDLLAAMNEVTNQIAANIQILLDKINAGGMSSAEEDVVATQLQAQIDALKAVAASSEVPVPPVPPIG